MEKLFDSLNIYTGKIGVSNALLILTGLLFFVLFFLKRQEGHYTRYWLYFWNGIFFTIYGFLFDIYRVRVFRPFLLLHTMNFVFWRNLILLVTLLPLYVGLVRDIVAILVRMIRDNRK